MRTRVLPLLLVLGLLTGCGGGDKPEGTTTSPDATQPATSKDLVGRSFGSTSVEGHDLVSGTSVVIDFTSRRQLAFRAGCNSSSGKYSIRNGDLEVKPGASTLMGCPEDLIDQDQWLMDFLASGVKAAVGESTLELTGNDDVSIILEDSPVSPTGANVLR